MACAEPDGDALDLQNYFPYFLGAIANRWTSSSSRIYLRRFGFGIAEWRVLASLDVLDSASSLEIANLVGMDPAAVSRAVGKLEQRNLIVPIVGRFTGRTKPYKMTPAGIQACADVRTLALEREKLLLQDLSEHERTLLLTMLRKIHTRVAGLPLE